jgi:hypothetical protein
LYGVREGEDGTVEGKEEGAGRDAGEGSAGTAGAPEKSTLEKILGDFLPCSIDVCKERKLSELGIDSISILQLSAILSSPILGDSRPPFCSPKPSESFSKILIESERVLYFCLKNYPTSQVVCLVRIQGEKGSGEVEADPRIF